MAARIVPFSQRGVGIAKGGPIKLEELLIAGSRVLKDLEQECLDKMKQGLAFSMNIQIGHFPEQRAAADNARIAKRLEAKNRL